MSGEMQDTKMETTHKNHLRAPHVLDILNALFNC